jgi:AcrR family transcriptional regulator
MALCMVSPTGFLLRSFLERCLANIYQGVEDYYHSVAIMNKTTFPDAPPGLRSPPFKGDARSDLKRERILRVAEALFSKQGYAKTTMSQIVDKLGVSKPFVYYYFHNKQDIFETLSWRPTVECFSALEFDEDAALPAHLRVSKGLERLIRATIVNYPSAFFPYREPQVYRPEYRAAQKKMARHFYARLCALMEQGRQEGMLEFDETKITALAAGSLPGFLFYWYRPHGRLSSEAMVAELTKLSCRVIGLRIRKKTSKKA